jgi:hypothetical protein
MTITSRDRLVWATPYARERRSHLGLPGSTRSRRQEQPDMHYRHLLTTICAAVAFAACDSSSATSDAITRSARHVAGTAGCPHRKPSLSSVGVLGSITARLTRSTTFCVYLAKRVDAAARFRGAPLDRAFGESVNHLPPRFACPADALLPSVVVLNGATSSSYVVLDMGGCPDIRVHGRQHHYLIGKGRRESAPVLPVDHPTHGRAVAERQLGIPSGILGGFGASPAKPTGWRPRPPAR